MADAGLRRIIRQHVPGPHWVSIETGSTEAGVPDLNGCWKRREVWVECKWAEYWKPKVDVAQVGWHLRRVADGGVTFFAVRRLRDNLYDELWLFEGRNAGRLKEEGLRKVPNILFCEGEPSRWDWTAFKALLFD